MAPLHLQLANSSLRRVLKRLHFPLEVMLVCVRWYAAYPLSLRNLEEMMAERGIAVDHSTVHRWALKILPVLASVFRSRKGPVGSSWRVDETYILVGGQWKYLYRAVDRMGLTVDFLLTARRDEAAARRFFEQAINLHDGVSSFRRRTQYSAIELQETLDVRIQLFHKSLSIIDDAL